jgi:hypothetical protein
LRGGYPPLRDPLGFLSTPNAESLKLTGAHTSSAAASSGTFLLVLLLTLRAGSHIGDPPPVVGCGSGRFWCTLFHSLSFGRVLGDLVARVPAIPITRFCS